MAAVAERGTRFNLICARRGQVRGRLERLELARRCDVRRLRQGGDDAGAALQPSRYLPSSPHLSPPILPRLTSHLASQRYVEEMAGIHAPGVFVGGVLCTDFACLCAQKEGGECSKQEVGYEAKFRDLPVADIQSRLKLLSASLAKSGKDDVWMKRASHGSRSLGLAPLKPLHVCMLQHLPCCSPLQHLHLRRAHHHPQAARLDSCGCRVAGGRREAGALRQLSGIGIQREGRCDDARLASVQCGHGAPTSLPRVRTDRRVHDTRMFNRPNAGATREETRGGSYACHATGFVSQPAASRADGGGSCGEREHRCTAMADDTRARRHQVARR